MRMHYSPSVLLLGMFLTASALLSALGCRKPAPREPSFPEEATVPAPGSSAAVSEPGPPAEPGAFWFTDVTAQTDVDFRHSTGTNPEKPFPAANGSGLGALDYDLDGWIDLYFVTGTPFPIDPTRPAPVNRFYRNLGNWRFEDVTEHSGLGHNGYSAGVAVGDYDADGFPDVYVTCYGANCLFHNQGDGTFEHAERSAHVADERWATSAAFLDYDGDGLLDLYVCNYAKWTWETNQFCGDRDRNIRVYCSPYSVEPEPDVLYHNGGDGTFEDATARAGVGDRAGRAQGIVAADLNDDGLVDLYVANDLNPNFLFLNAGDGTFRDATEPSGVAYDAVGQIMSSMGVEAADVDGDGRLDLFVTNFQGERNVLYRNGGDEWFDEQSDHAGLTADSLPWVGWGTSFADFDLDGWPDVVVTNGHVDDNRSLMGQEASDASPPLCWRNAQGRFEFLGPKAGRYFAERHPGRALIAADLDNDGDQDVVVGHQDQRPALLRNERLAAPSIERPSIVVRLVGTRSNRDAVGSTITLRSDQRTVVEQVKGGGSYLSAPDLHRVFAVDPHETGLRLEIRWPSGERSTLAGLRAGQSYVAVEPAEPSAAPGLFVKEL